MKKQYATLVPEWFEEVWNRHDANTIDRLLDKDGVAHGIVDGNGKELCGSEAFNDFHRSFLKAFPNITSSGNTAKRKYYSLS